MLQDKVVCDNKLNPASISSCNVVFLIFPIHTTFQSEINETPDFPLFKKMNSAIMIFK